jgi:hypothetical protein
VFRRKESAESIAAPTDPNLPAAQQAKGRPTPSRKEAEAARKSATITGSDPKASKKAAKEADRAARAKARAGLASGDPRQLPARDAGPVKAYVRDFIDGRWSMGEFFIPIAVVVLLLGFIQVQIVQVILLWTWSIMLVGVVLDTMWIVYRLRRAIAENVPNGDQRGAISYGVMRALQLRRFRLPPPKIRANGDPVKPKAPKVAK